MSGKNSPQEHRVQPTGAVAPPPILARFDEASLGNGERLFRKPCTFLKGVVDVGGLPDSDRPEVAFAGRSNVGKSSLLNALVGRKALARTSNTPGRTREINYFMLDEILYLVDMPGYGYARASKSLIKGWTGLIHDYLRGRSALRRVFLLIDSRHGPKESDCSIMSLMDEAAVSYQAVLTKIDKLKKFEFEKILEKTADTLSKHPAAYPYILATSSQKKKGIAELRAAIAELADY